MDLNKAIVNMYQQRAVNEGKKRRKFVNHPGQDVPQVTFEQLHGCDAAKVKLIQIVDYYKRASDGHLPVTQWPILICGSRSLGKTSLVRAAANYGDLKVQAINLRSSAGQTRGEFKEMLEQWIRDCESTKPNVILFDDLDSLKDKEDLRHTAGEAVLRLVGQNALVFCTTSSTLEDLPDIDFSFVIYLKRPDIEARFRVLKSFQDKYSSLSKLSVECLRSLAMDTPSFTVPELHKLLLLAEVDSGGIQSKSQCDKAIEIVKHSFKRGTHLLGQRPSVTWKDIGGMSDVQKTFQNILYQTRRGDASCKFAGIALYGPPGCGKTMVAQAMANEAGFNFISVKPAELINKYLGETERNIRRVFHDAREHDPCMIYFDEFDGLCGNRGSKDNITSAIQTLLSEMDGFADRGQSMILASTNRLEDIDPAMKRPGRLSKHIFVGPPNTEARKDILVKITNKPMIKLNPDIDLNYWAERTPKFTGAELAFLVSEAISKACFEENLDSFSSCELVALKNTHFEYALKEVLKNNNELKNKTYITKHKRKHHERNESF